MHSKSQIARKVLKLRALAARPGSVAEGEAATAAAASLVKEYGLTEAGIRLEAELDQYLGPAPDRAAERDRVRRDRRRDDWRDFDTAPTDKEPRRGPASQRPRASELVLEQHEKNPDRVHLAYDYLSSVCGVRPTFVWVFERDKLLTFDDPCPFCLASGIFDTRKARKRLEPVPR